MKLKDFNNDLCGEEPHDYVVCRECGQKFKSIEHSHLVHKHNMTIEEYENKYPNAKRVCTDTLIKLGRTEQAMRR